MNLTKIRKQGEISALQNHIQGLRNRIVNTIKPGKNLYACSDMDALENGLTQCQELLAEIKQALRILRELWEEESQ